MDERRSAGSGLEFPDETNRRPNPIERPRSLLDLAASGPEGPARRRAPLRESEILALLDQQMAAQPKWERVLGQATAAGRGALDTFSFGLDKHKNAFAAALFDPIFRGVNPVRAYKDQLTFEDALDKADEKHFSTARTAGKVGGVAAQLALLGPAEAATAFGVRASRAAPMIAREFGTLAGAGGTVGVGAQAISDLANRRISPFGDYLASGTAGAVGALSAPSGQAGYAGALAGAVNSMAHDRVNGRPISVDRALDAASFGNLFGTAAGLAGRAWSDGLPMVPKGKLGEWLAKGRTLARWERVVPGRPARIRNPGGRATDPDHLTYRRWWGNRLGDLVEVKFGISHARRPRQGLSEGQELARRTRPGHRFDNYLPQDIGAIFGLPAGTIGYHAFPPNQPE